MSPFRAEPNTGPIWSGVTGAELVSNWNLSPVSPGSCRINLQAGGIILYPPREASVFLQLSSTAKLVAQIRIHICWNHLYWYSSVANVANDGLQSSTGVTCIRHECISHNCNIHSRQNTLPLGEKYFRWFHWWKRALRQAPIKATRLPGKVSAHRRNQSPERVQVCHPLRRSWNRSYGFGDEVYFLLMSMEPSCQRCVRNTPAPWFCIDAFFIWTFMICFQGKKVEVWFMKW